MKIFYTSVILLLSVSAQAQQSPLEADRPDQTESVATVPAKHFQLETGVLYEKNTIGDEEEKTFTAPSLLAKYGINDRFELRLIIENSNTEITQNNSKTTISGISPVEIGLKIRLLEEKGIIPATSILIHTAIPKLASNELQADHFSSRFRLSMQHTVSRSVSIGYNLGAEWDGVSPEATGIYTLTGGFKLSEKFGAFAELFGFVPEKSEASHSFDCGFTFFMKQNLMFDISGGFGLNKFAPDYFIGCGFSFRLPK